MSVIISIDNNVAYIDTVDIINLIYRIESLLLQTMVKAALFILAEGW